MRIFAASALLLAAVCCGCVTGPGGQTEGDGLRQYLVDRGNDFADIWEVHVNGGPGLLISVKAAPGLKLASGYINAEKVGMSGRYFGGWQQRGCEFCIPLNYGFQNYLYDPLWGNDYLMELMAKFPKIQPAKPGEDLGPTWPGLFDGPGFRYDFWGLGYDPKEYGIGTFPRPIVPEIEVKVHVFFAGIDFGISLAELWDFGTGIFGLDFGKDDLRARLAIAKAMAKAKADPPADVKKP